MNDGSWKGENVERGLKRRVMSTVCDCREALE